MYDDAPRMAVVGAKQKVYKDPSENGGELIMSLKATIPQGRLL